MRFGFGIACTVLLVATICACAEEPAPKPPPEKPLTADEVQTVRKLIARLDDDDFDTRRRALLNLAAFGAKAEPVLREIAAEPPSAEVRVTVGRLLMAIDALKGGLNGDWGETREGIGYTDYHSISIGPDGALVLVPTDYSEHRQYVFSNGKLQNGELVYHQVCNPGYEFDVRLRITGKDSLEGTAIRSSDGEVFSVMLKRVTEKPQK